MLGLMSHRPLALTLGLASMLHCSEQPPPLASRLIALNSSVLGKNAPTMLQEALLARRHEAATREAAAFAKVASRADWESYREARLAALKRSIGDCLIPAPTLPAAVAARPGADHAAAVELVGTIEGDGYRVENLVIAGHSGLPIPANFYLPAQPVANMPGILIIGSHHAAKTQGELQDMGMTWARSGCAVLVLEHLAYGERAQQGYGGREDYRWRYHSSMQMYAASDHLLGWMVAEQRRGLDLLAARPGVDPGRLIVIGAVAGGGDQAAVLAALDQRVACAIPYNFGSSLPDRPTSTGGDFDASRCPRANARDGFTPWMLVAASAPRFLIHAHEFAWNAEEDASFARIAHIYELYGARSNLDATHGHGRGSQSAAEASHCNQVGATHRKGLYPILERWLRLPIPSEHRARLKPGQLTCLDDDARARWEVRPLHVILAAQAQRQVAAARATLTALPQPERTERLRHAWSTLLGSIEPGEPELLRTESVVGDGFIADRLLLATESDVQVPVLLLKPTGADGRLPVVLALAQGGKDLFVAKRAWEIAELLSRGVAVCLVDVRGTGETRPEGDRYWYGQAVEQAAVSLVLGEPLLAGRLRDLRSVLQYLRRRSDLDTAHCAVWGESFATTNSALLVDPPMQTDASAAQAEPLGAIAAMLLALFEADVQAVLARGGLIGYASLLDGPAAHVVLDAIVPNATTAGDLADLAAALAPRRLRLEGMVDGRNRLAGDARLARDYAVAREAFSGRPGDLRISTAEGNDAADWLAEALGR